MIIPLREQFNNGIDDLQGRIAYWAEKNWPDDGSNPLIGIVKAAKVGEEAGEVIGAAIKQGRPGVGIEELKDEIGDVFISLVGVAEAYGLSISECITSRWYDEVQHRGPRGSR